MAEELILTTPVTEPAKTTDKYKVVALLFDYEMNAIIPPPPALPMPGFIQIRLKDNLGVTSSYTYTGDEALDYIKFINTGNFTTKSLHKRILEKLSNDGKLVGTVSGAPDVPVNDYD